MIGTSNLHPTEVRLRAELQQVTLERDEAQAKLPELQEQLHRLSNEGAHREQQLAQLNQELQVEQRVSEAYRRLIVELVGRLIE